jgi:hypothetical protein
MRLFCCLSEKCTPIWADSLMAIFFTRDESPLGSTGRRSRAATGRGEGRRTFTRDWAHTLGTAAPPRLVQLVMEGCAGRVYALLLAGMHDSYLVHSFANISSLKIRYIDQHDHIST